MNKKKLLIIGLVFVFLFSTIPIGTQGVQTNSSIEKIEKVADFQATNVDEASIELTINPGNFEFGSENTDEGWFATVALPSYGFSYVKGEAKLPVIRKMIEIPQQATPFLKIDYVDWEHTSLAELSLPNTIIPAQMSVEKIPEPVGDFYIDNEYYATNSYFPESVAIITETGIIRGRHFAQIEISPIQYNPATADLKLMNSCQISIDFPNSNLELTYDKIERYSTQRYENYFSNIFENYGFYEQGLGSRNDEGFLAIVYDNFYDEIQPLANLKISKGYDVTVTKTSDIPGGPTKENIYDYIEDAYDTWSTPPAYVLLVGDTPQIPTYSGQSSYTEADLYYVTVDGSDFLPDIYIGRFPGSQESHIESMVDKTVYYETGNFPSNEWIKKAAFIASSDQGQLAEQTHNHVIDTYLLPNGYTCDKIYEASGGSTQDITNALNEGRSLCVYSGHGYSGGWSCVSYGQTNVNSLINEDMYPFVCSHACSTNPFGNSECFGETWVRATDKGALAFWGASASTYWDEDDILERGMFQGWWDDGLDWIGGMTDMGLYYVYENYSGGGSTRYYYEAYNINGDPSVRLWSDDPNSSPDTPSKPNGPDEGVEYQELTFSASTTDPEGEMVYYQFDWGNGETSQWYGPVNSGETIEGSYSWEEVGTYEVKVKAKDINNRESGWSDPHTITILPNEAPSKPTIDAPIIGGTGKQITITVSADDPEGHDVYFYVRWGDDSYLDYTGPYTSGEEVEFQHSYSSADDYTIVVKAMDEHGAKGPQSQVKIRIIKNRAVTNQFLFRILEKILNFFYLIT